MELLVQSENKQDKNETEIPEKKVKRELLMRSWQISESPSIDSVCLNFNFSKVRVRYGL